MNGFVFLLLFCSIIVFVSPVLLLKNGTMVYHQRQILGRSDCFERKICDTYDKVVETNTSTNVLLFLDDKNASLTPWMKADMIIFCRNFDMSSRYMTY